jgi:hypothetical protein
MSMAGKKVKRAAAKVAKAEECACCTPNNYLMETLLIIVGGIGLVNAVGYINWPGFSAYFPFVWSILVLVIGIKEVMDKGSCTC